MLNAPVVRRSVTAVLALSLSVGLMACNPATPPATNAVTAVTVSPTTAALNLTTTKTVQATATVTVTGTAAKTVAWTTDAATVASVSSTGLITAVGVGTANVKACSTVAGATTKCGTVAVTVTAGTTPAVPTAAFKVQFGTAAAPLGTGFALDTGAAFAGTSGWVTEATAASATPTGLNMTSAARYRNPSDTTNVVQSLAPEQYAAILMDCGDVTAGNTCASPTEQGPGAWVYKVNSGKYDVTVSVGDADKRNTNSSHVINVEGVNVIAATSPAAGAFVTGSKTSVSVTDGLLTVDSVNGKNTKINYIIVTPSAVQ